MPTLKVTSGPGAGQSLAVDRELVIGRENADLAIADAELSRRHAVVRPRGDAIEVEDLGSVNGTFVDGRRIHVATQLSAGTTVRMGSTQMTVELELARPDATAPREVPKAATTAQRAQAPAGEGPPPVAAPRRALRVVTGTAPGTRIPLGAEPLTIGREARGPGTLDSDPELSRRHATISEIDGRVVVEDLGSTNGTFVKGRRITAPTVIEAGEAIRVGTTTLQLLEVSPVAPSRVAGAALSAVSRVRSAETTLLGRLAAVASRRSRQILAGTAIFVVIAAVFGAPVAGILPSQPYPDPDVESSVATDRLEEASGRAVGVGLLVLVRAGEDVSSPGARAKVDRVLVRIREEKHVAQVIDFYKTGSPALVSKDKRSTYVSIVFKHADEDEIDEVAADLRDDLEKQRGVIVGGKALVGQSIGEQSGEDLGKAEGLAFPILFIASLFIFRGLVAALLPLFMGIITIFTTFLVLRLLNAAVTEISVYALNMVIALGLGLAIDYSLFIVSRYREELARHGPGPEAIRRTLQTAGRTIVFSALTVAAALSSLLVFPQKFTSSMGIGGAAVALIALSVSLVALPALLAVLGPRINSLSPRRWRESAERSARQERGGFWYRLSQIVMRRPLPVALASAALLIAMGLPFLRIEFNSFDAQTLPTSSNVRKVDTAIQTEFVANRGRQVNLAVEASPRDAAKVESYANGLKKLPHVVDVERPRQLSRTLWQVDVVTRHADRDERTLDLVRAIRDRQGPFPVSAAGGAAAFIDQQASLGDHLPLGLAVISLVTVFLLFALTGSVLLPIKSLIMNMLTVSAAFGLLVLIFQDGHLEGLLAFESEGGIEASQPILIFALAFGLSTDYAVFLLTRIKEARDAGASEGEAVALGLERTGRIVTAAALLFCIAVGAFATSQIIFIKQLGLGVAFAVIIDATIVRALLVPSLMALLGRRNWWAPGPLRRLHTRVGISEGEELPRRAAPQSGTP